MKLSLAPEPDSGSEWRPQVLAHPELLLLEFEPGRETAPGIDVPPGWARCAPPSPSGIGHASHTHAFVWQFSAHAAVCTRSTRSSTIS